MNQKLIDLNLIDLSSPEKNTLLLSDLLQDTTQSNILVILGSPGSGKTAILKKYSQDDSKNSQYIEIKRWLNDIDKINPETTTLLLDSLDEYRNNDGNDPSLILPKLAQKINSSECEEIIKIVITCRSIDWYGEKDANSLQKELANSNSTLLKSVSLYKVSPLNTEQQEFIFNQKAPKSDLNKFNKNFSHTEFTTNPQTLIMLISLYQNDPNIASLSKVDLYTKFIKLSTKKSDLSTDEIFKYAGYLACFEIFTVTDYLPNPKYETLKDIACQNNYFLKKLKLIIKKTTLFSENGFLHKTIAEFLCAQFLHDNKINNNIEGVISLFVKNTKIPSNLRGTFSWLSTLSTDEKLFQHDSVYQSIYSDNSMLTTDSKKTLISCVKKYAVEVDPYFYSTVYDYKEVSSLYEEKMDTFIIQELKESLSFNNHYKFFLASILVHKKLSTEMLKAIKKIIGAKDQYPALIDIFLKNKQLNTNIVYLKQFLDTLCKAVSTDENSDSIKHLLLEYLYLKKGGISSKEITPYIFPCKDGKIFGIYSYLENTPYEEQGNLIKNIYKKNKELNGEHREHLCYEIANFTEDFFTRTVFKYLEEKDVTDLYKTIIEFKPYLEAWEEPLEYPGREKYLFGGERTIKSIESTHKIIQEHYYQSKPNSEKLVKKQNQIKENDRKLEIILQKLFSLWVDDYLKEGSKEEAKFLGMHFSQLFGFSKLNNPCCILADKIQPDKLDNYNKKLFELISSYSYNPELGRVQVSKQIKDKAEQCALSSYVNKIEEPMEIDKNFQQLQNKQKEEREGKKKEEKRRSENNNNYFYNKEDEAILNCFSDISWISQALYIENSSIKYTNRATSERLKKLLQQYIYNPSIRNSTEYQNSLYSIKRLIQYFDKTKTGDMACYVSLAVHKTYENDKIQELPEDFLKYLYILCVKNSFTRNIIKSNFSKYIEENKKTFSIKTLKESLLIKIDVLNFLEKDIFDKYIEEYNDIKKLKNLLMSYHSKGNAISSFCAQFIAIFKNEITKEDLERIENAKLSTEIKEAISALLYLEESCKKGEEPPEKEFTTAMVTSLFYVFNWRQNNDDTGVKALGKFKYKITFINCVFNLFNTTEKENIKPPTSNYSPSGPWALIEFIKGFMRSKYVDINTLNQLLKKQKKIPTSIWTPKLLNFIAEKKQEVANISTALPWQDVKKFITEDSVVVDNRHFFKNIQKEFTDIKKDIEANRDSQKNNFYNTASNSESSKKENECRNNIVTRLKDRFRDRLKNRCQVTPEKLEAGNFVDINIKSSNNNNFEVQIECKKDKNQDIYSSIKNQLIEKYLKNKVQYGIYLVFYFGENTLSAIKLKQALIDKIPLEYKTRIKIIIIDLTMQ